MTTQNPENSPPVETPAVQQAAPQGLDSRRRLRELLSVPERDRSDEQWDEIIELEIQLAPGNRLAAGQEHGASGGQSPAQSRSLGAPGPGGQQPKKHRPRNSNNRRPRTNKPVGNPA